MIRATYRHIDDADVAKVKQLASEGLPGNRIAAVTGICRHTVQRILGDRYRLLRYAADFELRLSQADTLKLAQLKRDYRLAEANKQPRQPHTGNLFLSLRQVHTGILWEEKRQELGIPTLEDSRPERSREVGRTSDHAICNAPIFPTPGWNRGERRKASGAKPRKWRDDEEVA